MVIISATKSNIKTIFETVKISNWNQRMTTEADDQELGLYNPYSKICCIII